MKRIIPAAVITLGIVLILGAFSLLLKSPQTSQTTLDLPNELAGFRITDLREGIDAIAIITDLHGREFPIDHGVVGIYGNREITVWVAGAASETIARQMTSAMQQKIGEGNSPFTPINEINDGNREVYALEGMGQRHYYFQSNNLVIWLAVNPAFADEALQQILEVYS